MRTVLLWVAVVLYASTIFYLSSLTNPLPELTVRFSDKLLHGVEYGGLGLLLVSALRSAGVSAGRAIWIGILLASAYAASDEWHQSFVSGRDSSVFDWIADTAGGCAGALAAALWWRRGRIKRSSSPAASR